MRLTHSFRLHCVVVFAYTASSELKEMILSLSAATSLNLQRLSSTRKADRKEMAKRLLPLVEGKQNGRVEIGDNPLTPRFIDLTLHLGDAQVLINLYPGNEKIGFLGHWNTKCRFASSFGMIIGGTVNQHHGRKATTIRNTFEDFFLAIEAGFKAIEDGSAFA